MSISCVVEENHTSRDTVKENTSELISKSENCSHFAEKVIISEPDRLIRSHDHVTSDRANVNRDYDRVTMDRDDVITDYNVITSDYDSISPEYIDITSDYDSISPYYSDITTDYSNLTPDYSVSSDYNSTTAGYDNVTNDYDDFQSTFQDDGRERAALQTENLALKKQHSHAKTPSLKRQQKSLVKCKVLKPKTTRKLKNKRRGLSEEACGSMDIRRYLTVNKVDGESVKTAEQRFAIVGNVKFRDIRDFFRRP